MKKTPNIFEYAKSELSQDAFICWLIAWADPNQSENDKYLNKCASKFVVKLIEAPDDYEINTIEIAKQWNKIDVRALVNNQFLIVIEDKKGTKEHSNQLEQYAEIAREHYKNTSVEIKLVYFKMQEQGRFTDVEKAGFSVFCRAKMLEILEEYVGSVNRNEINDIIYDYYLNLKSLNEKINSYKELPLDKWHWFSWIGFYSKLQNHLGGNWDYVPNASGGFQGFWWHMKQSEYKDENFLFYLQLEENQMVFKISCDKPEARYEIRDYYRGKLFLKAEELNIAIHQFGRIGQWMGVARLNESYRKKDSNGLIDMKQTIEELKKMQQLIDGVSRELGE